MLVEKEYPLSKGTLTLMMVTKLLVDQDNEMSKELLRKIFMQARMQEMKEKELNYNVNSDANSHESGIPFTKNAISTSKLLNRKVACFLGRDGDESRQCLQDHNNVIKAIYTGEDRADKSKAWEKRDENKKIRGLVNLGYGSDGLKVNLSVNGIEEVSDYVMVLDDDCKETELGVSGMDGDNELVDNVTGETVEGSFEECESLSFDKRLDAALDIQIVAAITKTLSCSLRTGIGVNGHNMIVDEGCIQKDIHLFGICHDLKHVEGQEDEYRSFKVTDAHSSDKISTCVDERYMQEEGLGKGIIGEEEMNINEKHKEELDMIRPGIEVKRGSSNVDDTSAGVDTNSNYIRLISVTQENNASTMGVSKIVVVDVYDSMFNFSERYGSTDFNKLVEMYNGKYDDNKEEDDFVILSFLHQ
ncbi:hypothetical protein Tco_1079990 [Tanacetum coccineum]|uniref:Uncharacterized protein n=1 Tax=Tanacetum coccineum TaxID=301880 RepID=A0ABQ5HU02_9ASTR